MTHLFHPRHPFYKEPAFAFAVTAALVLWMLFGATSCREEDAPPTINEQLQGMWVRDWIDFDTNMLFSDGACVACANIPDHQPHCWNYAYYTNKDTLTMVDMVSRAKFVCVVSFPTDTTAILSWVGGVDYYLTRI